MAELQLVLLFLLFSGALLLIQGHKYSEDENNPYRHVEALDAEGKYRLEWVVDWERERVFFNVTVETRGFVVFGIAKQDLVNLNVEHSDLIIAGVDWKGLPYISDRHAVGNYSPVVDAKQDWKLHSAWESESHTHLSFSRLFDTCDSQDIPINADTTSLIWGYGSTDNIVEYHFATRGKVSRYLLDGDLTPRIIREGRVNDPESQLAQSDVKVWRLRNNLPIPSRRTTYWCHVHKLNLRRKHHILGFTFTINNETQNIMHHMLLFRCVVPNPSSIFERFVNPDGEECYGLGQKIGQEAFRSCAEIKAGHAIGGLPIFFPDTMGIPIGDTGQSEYYILQTHYDNADERSDLVTDHSFDIYYSSELRPNDGGVLSVGQHIPGSPSILLPPRTTDHKIYGHCSPTCTRKMFPREGIKVVASLLHAHQGARRMAVQHFRNNKELPYIYKDDNWKIDFQPIKLLRNELTILPGDQITMRCHYDTTYTNRSTVGGPATDQEMCKTFLFYYNQIENFSQSMCRSELISQEYAAYYLGGVQNVTWDQPRLEFVALDPPHLAGMTLRDISDSRYVDWSDEQRARLKRDHTILPQTDVCLDDDEFQEMQRTGEPPEPTFVTYPLEASEYRLTQECSLVR